MGFRRGFKADANRLALRVRERLGLDPVDPIDPALVCAHYEIELIPLSDLDCDVSAFLGKEKARFSAVTVPRGHRLAIVHNDSHHPHRQRSNICHELAHCFLGHDGAPPLTSDGDRFHDSGIEAEANFVAGVLLVPNEAAIHVALSDLIGQAQSIYGVSQPMLDYRLRVSGALTILKRSRRI